MKITMRCSIISEVCNHPSNVPKAPGDVFKYLFCLTDGPQTRDIQFPMIQNGEKQIFTVKKTGQSSCLELLHYK